MALEIPWHNVAESQILFGLTRDWANPGGGNVLFQRYFDQASEWIPPLRTMAEHSHVLLSNSAISAACCHSSSPDSPKLPGVSF